jgi:hypothetical protein
VSTLFPRTIYYYRIEGAFVRGEWKTNTPVPSTFKGSVQNITSKDTKSTEDARQDIGRVRIYSSTKLNVGEQDTPYSGDVVLWEGRHYEIVEELPFTNGIIPHYKYIAAIRPEFQA